MKKKVVMYMHGKGGNIDEAKHYEQFFSEYEVYGFDYQFDTPWGTVEEIRTEIEKLKEKYDEIILIANSIGAYFSMNAGISNAIHRAFFISPMVNMEKLIMDMMGWANVTEEELREKKEIETAFGETLSWDYLSYVREHPIKWEAQTDILYGSLDQLISYETISNFATAHHATLTVMEGGEHWFHTKEQMDFLDRWMQTKL